MRYLLKIYVPNPELFHLPSSRLLPVRLQPVKSLLWLFRPDCLPLSINRILLCTRVVTKRRCGARNHSSADNLHFIATSFAASAKVQKPVGRNLEPSIGEKGPTVLPGSHSSQSIATKVTVMAGVWVVFVCALVARASGKSKDRSAMPTLPRPSTSCGTHAKNPWLPWGPMDRIP